MFMPSTLAQRFNAGDTVSDDVKVPPGTKGAFPPCIPSTVRDAALQAWSGLRRTNAEPKPFLRP